MKLVMIHGRAQAGKDPAVIKKEWIDALKYGLARAERTLPPGTTIELPFYGDELKRLVDQANAPLAIDAKAKGPVDEPEAGIRAEILLNFAQAAGVSEADISREFSGEAREKGPLNWAWVHAVLKAIDRVPGLNSNFIDDFTRDVYVYLTYPAVRARIDAIVDSVFDGSSSVILAHSLGTVVAYDVLIKRAGTEACPRFVTVGSPLGIKGIKRLLTPPLRSPSCVKNWFNAFDPRDVVALQPLDARNFGVAPPIENKGDVMNFTDNRHGIAGYLADPIVANKIAEYL